MHHEPRRDVDWIAEDAELGAVGRSHGAYHHGPGRNPDAHIEAKPPIAGASAIERFICADDSDRGGHSSIHVVWLLAAGAESRHHSITHKLLDHTSTDRNRPDDSLEVRVEHVEQTFRIVREVLCQPGEAAKVREQDGRIPNHWCRTRVHQGPRPACLIPLPQTDQPREIVVANRGRALNIVCSDQLATNS
jgi:hypothetical protein